MKNSFGTSVIVTLFGESHGPAVGGVLDGLAPGIPVDPDFIARQLQLRRPYGKISTPRVEADKFEILSGVFEGRTTGTPLCIVIPNENTASTRPAARIADTNFFMILFMNDYFLNLESITLTILPSDLGRDLGSTRRTFAWIPVMLLISPSMALVNLSRPDIVSDMRSGLSSILTEITSRLFTRST